MNCTLSESNCWLTPVGRLTRWLTGFKPKNSSQNVHASYHGEQYGAPEQQSQVIRKLRVSRRRPVTIDIRRGNQEAGFSCVLESNDLSYKTLKKGVAKITKQYRFYDYGSPDTTVNAKFMPPQN